MTYWWRREMPGRSRSRKSKSSTSRRKKQPNSALKPVSLERKLQIAKKLLMDMSAGRRAAVPSLPNVQDNLVIRQLATVKIGDLPVDQFGRLFGEDESSQSDHIIELRVDLIRVYIKAADVRLYARATQEQLKSAQSALSSVVKAVKQLDHVRPQRQRGFQALFGSPVDDTKGLDELNDFGARCSTIRMDIINCMQNLSRTIENENAKPRQTAAGERKKRLRTLVEALADWWESKIGESIAPYVYAKKLGKGIPAFVVGRQGDFIELAQALLSNIDVFKESEVISAVTNVYEDRLPRTKQ